MFSAESPKCFVSTEISSSSPPNIATALASVVTNVIIPVIGFASIAAHIPFKAIVVDFTALLSINSAVVIILTLAVWMAFFTVEAAVAKVLAFFVVVFVA